VHSYLECCGDPVAWRRRRAVDVERRQRRRDGQELPRTRAAVGRSAPSVWGQGAVMRGPCWSRQTRRTGIALEDHRGALGGSGMARAADSGSVRRHQTPAHECAMSRHVRGLGESSSSKGVGEVEECRAVTEVADLVGVRRSQPSLQCSRPDGSATLDSKTSPRADLGLVGMLIHLPERSIRLVADSAVAWDLAVSPQVVRRGVRDVRPLRVGRRAWPSRCSGCCRSLRRGRPSIR
jgi:hypothetical protein